VRAPLTVIAMGIAACAPSVEVVIVPVRDDASAMIVAEVGGDEVALHAIDLGRRPRYVTLRPRAGASLFVLDYGTCLAGLDLAGGLVPIASPGRPLPTPDHVRAPSGEGWAEVPIPGELAALSIAGDPSLPPECVPLESTSWTLSVDSGQPQLAVALSEDEVFFGFTSGQFFRFGPSGLEPLVEIPRSSPARAAARWRDRIFTIGDGGRVAEAGLDLSFTVSSTLPDRTAGRRWMDASRGDAELELFTASDQGHLARFFAGSWTEIGSRGGDTGHAGVIWLGEDEAIFVGFSGQDVLHYAEGRFDLEALPEISAIDLPLSATFIEGIGPLVGTQLGVIYVRGSTGWRVYQRLEVNESVLKIAPIDRGVLVAGRFGFVQQYHPGVGACPNKTPMPDEVKQLVPFSRGWLAMGSSAPDPFITLFERAKIAPPSCGE
jgi:hypothetical protein